MAVLKANQAVSGNIAAIQERNMQFVQSFFTEGVETLKSQVESARTLIEELQQKTQEQQEMFQRLTKESMEAYMSFFRDPLAAYQQTVEAAQTATRQGLESMQKATKQTLDAAQKANTTPKS
jgi:uncharacterized protein YukE